MLLDIQSLPADIRSVYGDAPEEVHKAVKKGSSTIIVHTTDRERHVWKKHGKRWSVETEAQVRDKEAERIEKARTEQSQRTLWGVRIP